MRGGSQSSFLLLPAALPTDHLPLAYLFEDICIGKQLDKLDGL